jgi:hypothetical protein
MADYATLLRDHATLTCRAVDRVFLQAFIAGVIRDHLDVGRPRRVVLVFNRRLMPKTPGTFSTKVITRGVNPQLSCKYKSSRLKQYLKGGRPSVSRPSSATPATAGWPAASMPRTGGP